MPIKPVSKTHKHKSTEQPKTTTKPNLIKTTNPPEAQTVNSNPSKSKLILYQPQSQQVKTNSKTQHWKHQSQIKSQAQHPSNNFNNQI